MGVSALACAAFYATIAQGIRIVRDARDAAAASQLIEQRFEAIRARPLWESVITPAGMRAALSPGFAAGSGIGQATETFSVGAYPGEAVAFAISRQPNGAVTTTGNALPASQTCVRVTGTVEWGQPQRPRRHTRVVSTIFTKGGL
jgi:hypothetical protein